MYQFAKFSTFVAALALASTAFGDSIRLTFNGTSTTDEAGYTNGQNVSFSLLINDASLSTNGIDAGSVWFVDESIYSDTDIWAFISGTGISGAWARPSLEDISPCSRLIYHSTGELYVIVSRDTGSTGLFVNGEAVNELAFDLTLSGFSPTNIDSTTNACTFLGDYLGAYEVSSNSTCHLITDSTTADFTFSEVVISSVPEPATSAAAAGLGVLALTAFRRLRRRG